MLDKIREIEVIVADVVRETEDSTTLYLFTGDPPRNIERDNF